MIKKLFIFVLVLIPLNFVIAKKVAVLDDVSKPFEIKVDAARIYIIEGTTIFVYSLKDYKLLSKFGKKGEGPGEFKVRPNGRVKIYPLDDYIYVASIGRVSIFTKNGGFVKEIPASSGRDFKPVGHKHFISLGDSLGEGKIENGETYSAIGLLNSNLKKIKTIFKLLNIQHKGAIRVYSRSLNFKSYKKNIYISGKKGFIINVFDIQGNNLYNIDHKFKKIKITETDKKKVLQWFKKDPRYNEIQYQYIKKHIKFPYYYPAIDELRIKDNKIYVRTFNTNGNNYEFVIFDTRGNYLKTQYIYLERENPVYPYVYDIANGYVYQLIEDIENEKWELHINKID